MVTRVFITGLTVMLIAAVVAPDHSPLLDFCVADPGNTVQVNVLARKDPRMVQADDFLISGHLAGSTSNAIGLRVTPVTVAQLPGLNTLGCAPLHQLHCWGSQSTPHSPRATELPMVIKGSLEVGFITSNPDDRLILKALSKGDVFVFLQGLIHFQRNIRKMNAIVVSAFNSQNPGTIAITNAVFGSMPDIAIDILVKAFRVDKNLICQIQSKF